MSVTLSDVGFLLSLLLPLVALPFSILLPDFKVLPLVLLFVVVLLLPLLWLLELELEGDDEEVVDSVFRFLEGGMTKGSTALSALDI
jgi:hypothetical protein